MTADAGNGSDLAGIAIEETAKTPKRIMRIMGGAQCASAGIWHDYIVDAKG
jgi:hypothetical protein